MDEKPPKDNQGDTSCPSDQDESMDKDEKKEFLENDSCLEKGANDTRGAETNSKKKDDAAAGPGLKVRIRQKCACLALTWRGLIVFTVLCILLLILLIVIIVLSVHVDCWGGFTSKVCQTPDCLRIGADIVERLNTTAEPCDDYFDYSCGGWVEKYRHDYGANSTGRDSTLGQRVRSYRESVRIILNTLPYISDLASVEWKMKSFYDSCMNIDNVESAEGSPVKRILNQLHGWDVLGQWLVSAWDFNTVLAKLHGTYGVYPFFKPTVQLDEVLADKTIIKIEPSGLGLPVRSLYFRSRDDKVVEAYKQLLRDTAILLGATGPAATMFADDLFHFEKRIAEIYPEEDYAHRFRSRDQPTVGELRSWLPRILWNDHLNMIFQSGNIKENTRVVANRTYLTHISRIITNSDDRSLNNYMLWTLVRHYSPYLSSKFRQVIDHFYQALTGRIQGVDRWDFCVQEVEKMFPLAVASLYVDSEDFDENSLGNVTDLVDEVIETFGKRIDDYQWMDEKTKQITKEKVRLTELHVDPLKRVNDAEIVNHYIQLNILKPDFFQNILRGVEFRSHLAVTWLRNASSFVWFQPKDLENPLPFIIPSKRKLVIPALLLHEPIYSVNQPASINFGALGAIIGRTLIQTFEDADEYDKDWRRHNYHHHHRQWDDKDTYWAKIEFSPQWWSNYTLEKYERHQNCVADEYFKYEVRDIDANGHGRKINLHVNGNRTLDANMADLGGLTLAYEAYKNWVWKHGESKHLPAVHQNSQSQMFFLGYAQSMCSTEKPLGLLQDLLISRFSPPKIRVNGVIGHMRDFAWHYSCGYYAYMNQPTKCDTW